MFLKPEEKKRENSHLRLINVIFGEELVGILLQWNDIKDRTQIEVDTGAKMEIFGEKAVIEYHKEEGITLMAEGAGKAIM